MPTSKEGNGNKVHPNDTLDLLTQAILESGKVSISDDFPVELANCEKFVHDIFEESTVDKRTVLEQEKSRLALLNAWLAKIKESDPPLTMWVDGVPIESLVAKLHDVEEFLDSGDARKMALLDLVQKYEASYLHEWGKIVRQINSLKSWKTRHEIEFLRLDAEARPHAVRDEFEKRLKEFAELPADDINERRIMMGNMRVSEKWRCGFFRNALVKLKKDFSAEKEDRFERMEASSDDDASLTPKQQMSKLQARNEQLDKNILLIEKKLNSEELNQRYDELTNLVDAVLPLNATEPSPDAEALVARYAQKYRELAEDVQNFIITIDPPPPLVFPYGEPSEDDLVPFVNEEVEIEEIEELEPDGNTSDETAANFVRRTSDDSSYLTNVDYFGSDHVGASGEKDEAEIEAEELQAAMERGDIASLKYIGYLDLKTFTFYFDRHDKRYSSLRSVNIREILRSAQLSIVSSSLHTEKNKTVIHFSIKDDATGNVLPWELDLKTMREYFGSQTEEVVEVISPLSPNSDDQKAFLYTHAEFRQFLAEKKFEVFRSLEGITKFPRDFKFDPHNPPDSVKAYEQDGLVARIRRAIAAADAKAKLDGLFSKTEKKSEAAPTVPKPEELAMVPVVEVPFELTRKNWQWVILGTTPWGAYDAGKAQLHRYNEAGKTDKEKLPAVENGDLKFERRLGVIRKSMQPFMTAEGGAVTFTYPEIIADIVFTLNADGQLMLTLHNGTKTYEMPPVKDPKSLKKTLKNAVEWLKDAPLREAVLVEPPKIIEPKTVDEKPVTPPVEVPKPDSEKETRYPRASLGGQHIGMYMADTGVFEIPVTQGDLNDVKQFPLTITAPAGEFLPIPKFSQTAQGFSFDYGPKAGQFTFTFSPPDKFEWRVILSAPGEPSMDTVQQDDLSRDTVVAALMDARDAVEENLQKAAAHTPVAETSKPVEQKTISARDVLLQRLDVALEKLFTLMRDKKFGFLKKRFTRSKDTIMKEAQDPSKKNNLALALDAVFFEHLAAQPNDERGATQAALTTKAKYEKGELKFEDQVVKVPETSGSGNVALNSTTAEEVRSPAKEREFTDAERERIENTLQYNSDEGAIEWIGREPVKRNKKDQNKKKKEDDEEEKVEEADEPDNKVKGKIDLTIDLPGGGTLACDFDEEQWAGTYELPDEAGECTFRFRSIPKPEDRNNKENRRPRRGSSEGILSGVGDRDNFETEIKVTGKKSVGRTTLHSSADLVSAFKVFKKFVIKEVMAAEKSAEKAVEKQSVPAPKAPEQTRSFVDVQIAPGELPTPITIDEYKAANRELRKASPTARAVDLNDSLLDKLAGERLAIMRILIQDGVKQLAQNAEAWIALPVPDAGLPQPDESQLSVQVCQSMIDEAGLAIVGRRDVTSNGVTRVAALKVKKK